MIVRLNKYIAECGIASRREADSLIASGRVLVNGEVPEAGCKVSEEDLVTLDGKTIEKALPRMIAFYKPRGIVCTDSDKDRAKTVSEYLHLTEHLFPVGRLDKDSEGLLLLTNMGDLAERIARAGDAHEKEYEVTCKRPVTEELIRKMGQGVVIVIPENRSTRGVREEYTTRPCRVWKTGERSFGIVLTEGKNRQIRRMTAALGNEVTVLKRVRIMNVRLQNLKIGETRELTPEEIEKIEEVL